LGQTLAARRQECIIVSKTFKRDAVGARQDILESFRALGTGYIDIYMIHHVQWSEELRKVLAPGGVLDGLLQAKREGQIGFIGISGHHPDLLIEAIKTGAFDVVEIPHNAIDHRIFQPIIDHALEDDIGVLTMKALAAGMIVDSKDKVANALRFSLCVEGVGSVIVGMSTAEQVLFDLEIANRIGRCSRSERRTILDEIGSMPSDYWGLDSQFYDESLCPFNVPIAKILVLEKYRAVYKNGHRTKLQYSEMNVKAGYCQTCPGYCELPSPHGVSVRAALIKAHQKLSEPVTDREILQHGGELL
jgi:predicted aldo/keto reductase-like oxidoreductase